MPLDEPLLIIETQPIVEGAAEVLHGLERVKLGHIKWGQILNHASEHRFNLTIFATLLVPSASGFRESNTPSLPYHPHSPAALRGCYKPRS